MEIYVKNTYNGNVHKLGTDCHDSLYINSEGHIDYMNLQCCEGTQFGSYVFCDEQGHELKDWVEDYNYIGIGSSIVYSKESYDKAINDLSIRFISEINNNSIIPIIAKEQETKFTATEVINIFSKIVEYLKEGVING